MTAHASAPYSTDLHRGLVHHQHGELEQARRAYRKVLRKHPSDVEALRLLATLEMQRGRHAQAEQMAQRALRAAPGQASTHNTMGQVLCAQGRFAEACRSFEAALSVDATFASARASLGRCLLRTGQPAAGLEQMCTAARHEPGDAALAGEIAQALLQSGDFPAAERYFHLALEWAPNAPVSYVNLGAFYIDRDQPEQAAAFLAKAVELNPAELSAWMNLSRALRMLGELAAALECLEKLLALRPGDPDATAFAASILHQSGDYSEARRLFTEVLNAHPQHAMALQGLAELYEWSGDYEAAVERLQPRIESGGVTPELAVTYARALRRLDRQDQAVELLSALLADEARLVAVGRPLLRQLHFTLANLYDDLGRYDSAWQHVTTANSMQPVRAEANALRALMDRAFEMPEREAATPVDEAAIDERPVFIVGMPRSGTSLLEQILAAHPEVHALGETGCIAAALPAGYAESESDSQAQAAQAIRQAFESLMKSAPGQARRITEKTPLNCLLLGSIAQAFPGARIVHCMRHPLDTMLSCFFTDFRATGLSFTADLDALAGFYADYERLMAHWRGRLRIPLLDICYEELVSCPEKQIRRLIEFVGLEWDDGCLEHHLCRRNLHTSSHAQVRQPIYSRAVGRWRNYAAQLARLKAFDRA